MKHFVTTWPVTEYKADFSVHKPFMHFGREACGKCSMDTSPTLWPCKYVEETK